MNKLHLLTAFGIFFCAVFQAASAQFKEVLTFEDYKSKDPWDAIKERDCPNKLLDERIFDINIAGAFDRVCKEGPPIFPSPADVVKALQWKDIIAIKLLFDAKGNINDQNQDDYIKNMNEFFNDPKKTDPKTWTPIVEDIVLQFGDDSSESQKNLDKILSNKNLSKSFENNILNTIWKFKNAVPRTRYANLNFAPTIRNYSDSIRLEDMQLVIRPFNTKKISQALKTIYAVQNSIRQTSDMRVHLLDQDKLISENQDFEVFFYGFKDGFVQCFENGKDIRAHYYNRTSKDFPTPTSILNIGEVEYCDFVSDYTVRV